MPGETLRFSEGSDSNSTIFGFLADVQVVLRVLMSIRFTRLRSNVCWAKPNHGFFYCQHFYAIFFSMARAPPTPHAALAALPTPPIADADAARKTAHAKKAGKFPCFL